MPFNNWRAEAARIAAGMYGVELDRIPKEYLWRLWRSDVSVWEAAELCRNVAERGAAPSQPRRIVMDGCG
jgi:hypothetical protein